MQTRPCLILAAMMVLIAPSLSNPQGASPGQHVEVLNNLQDFLADSIEAVARDRRDDDEDYDDDDEDAYQNTKKSKPQSIFMLRDNTLLSEVKLYTSPWGTVNVELGKMGKYYTVVCTIKSTIQHPTQLYGMMQTFLNANSRPS